MYEKKAVKVITLLFQCIASACGQDNYGAGDQLLSVPFSNNFVYSLEDAQKQFLISDRRLVQ